MYASTLFTTAAFSGLFSLVSAHGAVYQISVGGQTFNSPLIGKGGDTGPFYVPSANGPVTDLTSQDMFCNTVGNKPTSTPTVDISKGNQISFYWNSGYSEGTNWPHNTGPMSLYMAKCDSDCTSLSASSTNFVKIEQQGFSSTGTWAQAAVHTGAPATFTLPSDLADGTYLMRHEIINLASTDEVFPACSQFTVTGGGNNDYFSSATTATFPGAYSSSDAGLSVAGSAIYSIKSNSAYQFPGPNPVETSDGGSSSSSSNSSSSTGASSAASSGSSSASAATGSAATGTASTSGVLAASATIPLPSSSAPAGVSGSASGSPTTSTSSTSGSAGDSCSAQWTACNAAWMSAIATTATRSAGASSSDSSYACQTQYESCMSASGSVTDSSAAATSMLSSSSSAETGSASSVVATTTASVAPTTTGSSSNATTSATGSSSSVAPTTTGSSSNATTSATGSSSSSSSVSSDSSAASASAATGTDPAASAPTVTARSNSFTKHLRRHHAGVSRLEFH